MKKSTYSRPSQNELANVRRDRGPAGTAPGVGPASPNELAIPTQHPVGADEERPPARSAEKPAGRGQKDTVGVLQTRAADPTAKNRKLVPEHNDLELLELTRTQTQCRLPRGGAETTDTPATRARAPPFGMRTARPYDREVTPDVPSSDQTDLRTPQGSQNRDASFESTDLRRNRVYAPHTRSRCRRFTTRIRSRHSRRTVPIHRSTKAFARGARTGVRIVRMPSERNTSSNPAVNLLSRSWIKNRIDSVRSTSVSMMFRACCVAHSPVGFGVIPARDTCRIESSMNTSA
jgi:hypothetical protein